MTSWDTITASAPRRWLETFIISALGPAAGLLYRPGDSLWLKSGLPWLYLLPLLCGAQYGLVHGIVSSALLSGFALWAVGGLGHWTDTLTTFAIELSLIGALSGQFRDLAERRRIRLTHTARTQAAELQRLVRKSELLRLSHARLEERMAATRWSLVGALEAARRRMPDLATRREFAEVVLDIVAGQAMVQSASVYWAQGASLLAQPVARLGEHGGAAHQHPLVLRAWRTRHLTAIVDPAAQLGEPDSQVLAAVPLLTASGCLGVLAIHQMPFIAFQAEQLRSVLLMVSELSDVIDVRMRELPSAIRRTPRPSQPGRRQARVPLTAPPPLGAALERTQAHANNAARPTTFAGLRWPASSDAAPARRPRLRHTDAVALSSETLS
jgi:hypothetical protein